MHPFRSVRRLLSRARQDWEDAIEGLFARPSHPPGPRPLRVMRLERRRVLSADFTLTATGLVLDGFDGAEGDTLAVTQDGDAYQFNNSGGWEQHDEGALPAGVAVEGNTLSVDRQVLEGLDGGVVVQGGLGRRLDVRLGDVDFSGLSGSVTFAGVTSIGQQQPFALAAAPTPAEVVASGGTLLSSFNASGNFEVLSFGSIRDVPGAQITIAGDATFISRAFSPDGDFDGDGDVDADDRSEHWVANYGMTSGATKYDGDANGDGRVDAADYTAWRDSVGQTGQGGIELADSPGDRLVVGGVATFDAAEPEGTHDIFVGVKVVDGEVANDGGWAEFGSINAYGANVVVHEDATTEHVVAGGPTSDVGEVRAYDFTLQAAGRIEVGAAASIEAENSVTLLSRYAEFDGDFNGDRIVDGEDFAIWDAHHGLDAGALKSQGDANGDGVVDVADYGVWRDQADDFAPLSDEAAAAAARGGIHVAGRLEAGGLVTLTSQETSAPEDRFEVLVEDAATANFGALAVQGSVVTVYEDGGTFKPERDGSQAGTHLHDINALQLLLVSAGPITDAPEAHITVMGGDSLGIIPDATFIVSDGAMIADGPLVQAITLADVAGPNLMEVEGLATFIVEPPATEAAGFTGPKGIDVGVAPSGAPAPSNFDAGAIRFSAPGATVRIAENSDTVIDGWVVEPEFFAAITAPPVKNSAETLDLHSAGSITDTSIAVVDVTGDATLQAAGTILLADQGSANAFEVGDLATFIITGSQPLRLGVDGGNAPAEAVFNTGRLRFHVENSQTRIAEDSGVVFAGWSVDPVSPIVTMTPPTESLTSNLAVSAQGSITDEANCRILLIGSRADPPDALFVATDGITLVDSGSENVLSTLGTTTFVVGEGKDIHVGVTNDGTQASAVFDSSRLRFSAVAGEVLVACDTQVSLDSWVDYSDPFLPSVINQNMASVLELSANGSISDRPQSLTTITGDASFSSGIGSILLQGYDQPASLKVGGLATFVVSPSRHIEVGGGDSSVFEAGRLRFSAPDGTVGIKEADSTLISDWSSESISSLIDTPPSISEARILELSSAGSITDTENAAVEIAEIAVLKSAGTIVLADAGSSNAFEVGYLANFIVTNSQPIRLGVDNSNAPAEAKFNTGRLGFHAENSAVRIAEDSSVVFANWNAGVSPIFQLSRPLESLTSNLAVSAQGSITDEANSQVRVDARRSGPALFVATEGITLADAAAGNSLIATGRVTFVAGEGHDIDVGVTASGLRADARFDAGSLLFSAPGGDVRIAEDSDTLIDSWVGVTDPFLPATLPVSNQAHSLVLSSAGSISDNNQSKTAIADGATMVAEDIFLADVGSDNALTVGGLATFVVGPGGLLTVGTTASGFASGATFTAGGLRFSAPGGVARIAEDDATLLAGWPMGSTAPILTSPPMATEALTIELASAGAITDAEDAVTIATGRNGAGQREYNPLASATFVAAESISLADAGAANKLIVDGGVTLVAGAQRIDVGVTGAGAIAPAEFVAGSVRFSAPGVGVRLAEDAAASFKGVTYAESPGTVLSGWTSGFVSHLVSPQVDRSTALSLELVSVGPITDTADALVQVSGDAGFRVLGDSIPTAGDFSIRLADTNANNQLNIEGDATFVVSGARGIDVGVTPSGMPAIAGFNAGSIRFYSDGGAVRLAEDTSTVLASWGDLSVGLIRAESSMNFSRAETLELLSAGTITDEAAAQLFVSDDATFIAAGGDWAIDLADAGADNRLVIGDLATYITTAPGRGMRVGVNASFEPAAAQYVAGRTRFTSPAGDVKLAEDKTATIGGVTTDSAPGTLLAGWTTDAVSPLYLPGAPTSSAARTLEVVSAGPITDAADSVIVVAMDAGFLVTDSATLGVSDNAIRLADCDAGAPLNRLTVGGDATFIAQGAWGVDVGVTPAGDPAAAFFNAGTVRFSTSGGQVRIAEDSGTVLAGWGGLTDGVLGLGDSIEASAASSLELTSNGAMTDEPNAKVWVFGNATLKVSSIVNVTGDKAIVLANEGSANELIIGGDASFTVVQTPTGVTPKGVDIGVIADGTPADALFTAGTIGFNVPGAAVRIAEDNGTVLGGASSLAEDLQLISAGAITDTPDASTTLTRSAEINAAGGAEDVTLGAGSSMFSMGDPEVFNASEYLAVQARNVSVEADSGVNIRTGVSPLTNLDEYSRYEGVYFLTAAGSVSQVTTAAPTPLAAQKISVASQDGAVLLRLVELTSEGDDPNLQIKAGYAKPEDMVSLNDIVASGKTIGEEFAGSDIPSPNNSVGAPVLVEADDEVTGVRGDQPARDGNPGFEDVLVDDNGATRNSRLFETLNDGSNANEGEAVQRRIDELYSAIVIVRGDAVIGDVLDIGDAETNPRRAVDADAARGFVVTDYGNAYLATTEGGDLLFTNNGREGGDVLDASAVQVAGGVFTAVAAGALTIDTKSADEQGADLRTTKLTSATGTVTSVGSEEGAAFGPRVLLDPSTEEGNAATTGLVRADQDFEQRLTLAVGYRGEDNVLVEVEWADVADIREDSAANVRDVRDPNRPVNTVGSTDVPGSTEFADLVQTPVDAIEATTANPDYKYQQLGDAFRVGTLTHNYAREFVPNNPAQNTLPTTIRVYNDSSINLYDQGGARDLNSASLVIAPRIITLPPPGYFILSEPDLPQQYEPIMTSVPRTEPTQTPQQTTVDIGKAAVASTAEEVQYGRVDASGDWVVDIPGEVWPQVREDAEGDFLREIRDKIDEGPYSEGRYIIKVVTPRSEQLLEEWVKGDDPQAEAEAMTPPAEAVRPAAPNAAAPEGAGPAGVAPGVAAPVAVPQGAPLSLQSSESAPSEATNAAFAAMAAVGVWRRRLNEAGPFTLDADGVAFTRVRRQRRRRGGD